MGVEQQIYIVFCLVIFVGNMVFSNVLRPFGNSGKDEPSPSQRLRYPEPFNQMLRYPDSNSDDHDPNEQPDVKGVVENGDENSTDLVDTKNAHWENDDDQEPLVCTVKSIMEEEARRSTCLSLLTDLYDLAKGYDQSDVDVKEAAQNRKNKPRNKRQVVAVTDIIANAINVSLNDTVLTLTSATSPTPTASPALVFILNSTSSSDVATDSSTTSTSSSATSTDSSQQSSFGIPVPSALSSSTDGQTSSSTSTGSVTLASSNLTTASSDSLTSTQTATVVTTASSTSSSATVTSGSKTVSIVTSDIIFAKNLTGLNSQKDGDNDDDDDDDDAQEFVLVQPGATRPPQKNSTHQTRSSRGTKKPVTTRAPFNGSKGGEDDVSAFVLTVAPASQFFLTVGSGTMTGSQSTDSSTSTTGATSGITATTGSQPSGSSTSTIGITSGTSKPLTGKNDNNNDDDDDDISPEFILVRPGESQPVRKNSTHPTRSPKTPKKTVTRKGPFTGSRSGDEEIDISPFLLTLPPGASTPSTNGGQVGVVPLTYIGPKSNKSIVEIGIWIHEWKLTVDNAVPGFLPSMEFTDKQKMVCTRLATLPYIRDRCCVTMSIVCPEFMTPDTESSVGIKTTNNNNALPNTDDNTDDKNININVDSSADGNSNGEKQGPYNLRNLLADTVENLARLVSDLIKRPSTKI